MKSRRRELYYYHGTQDRPAVAPGGVIQASVAQEWITAGGTVLLPLYVSGTAAVTSVPTGTSIIANIGATAWTFNGTGNATGLRLGTSAINMGTVNGAWGTARQITAGTSTGTTSFSIASASTHFSANNYVYIQPGQWTGTTFAPSVMTASTGTDTRLIGGYLTRCSSSNSTTLTTRDGLAFALPGQAAAYNVNTLAIRSLTLDGIRFEDTSANGFACLLINFCDGLTLNNVTAYNSRVNGIAAQMCFGVTYNAVSASNIGPLTTVAGTGYALQFRSCYNVTLNDPVINTGRVGVQRDDGCFNMTINRPKGNAVNLVRNHGGPDANITVNDGGIASSWYQEGNETWRVGPRGPVVYNNCVGELLQVVGRQAGTQTFNNGSYNIVQILNHGNDANAQFSVSAANTVTFSSTAVSVGYDDVVRFGGSVAPVANITFNTCTLTQSSATHRLINISSSAASSVTLTNTLGRYTNTSNTSSGFVWGEGSGSASVSFSNATLTSASASTIVAVSTVAGMPITITSASSSTINGSTFNTASTTSRG